MDSRIFERCIYCHADGIEYSRGQAYVKCTSCGVTFPVAKFQSEQAELRAQLEAGERAKAELEDAQRAQEEAQRRLNEAMAALEGIHGAQEDAAGTARQILSALDEDRQIQLAIGSLLQGLRADQAGSMDALSGWMLEISRSQDGAQGKLELLQTVSEKILSAQGDGAKMDAEIAEMIRGLRLDGARAEALIRQFSEWSKSMREEDVARLEAIREASAELADGQRALAQNVDDLRARAEQTLAAVEEFRDEYQADRVKELYGMYQQAMDMQFDREFAEAEKVYRRVIAKGGDDIEVHWRMILCHYGVEYQRGENGLMPTILNPDLSDPAELSVRQNFLKFRGREEFGDYEVRLREIDGILEKYRRLRGDPQMKYDVFISVKQSAPGGGPTTDSVEALKLHGALTAKGLRVFNSRVSLSELPAAGKDYEPYIITALLSAKVLIVVGSRPEYMDAQWVRNEWSRFKWLREDEVGRYGRSERLLICYLVGGMRPEQIPRALDRGRQAIAEGYGAEKALDQALASVFPIATAAPAAPVQAAEPQPQDESARQIQEQMEYWLMIRRFDLVLSKYEELQEKALYPGEARIHMLALCARREIEGFSQLVKQPNLSDEREYILAAKFARTEENRRFIADLLEQNRKAAEEAARKEAEEAERKAREEALRKAWAREEELRKAREEEREEELRKAREEERKEELRKAREEAASRPYVFVDAEVEKSVRFRLHKTKGEIYPPELAKIRSLYFSGRGVSNFEDLAAMPNLEELTLAQNSISDISPLTKLTNLKSLDLSRNNIRDIALLAGLTNLKELNLSQNNIHDISPLAELRNLEFLALRQNNIGDIWPLAGLTNLKDLNLSQNHIRDITSLAGLTKLWSLDLRKNNIYDISPVAMLKELDDLQVDGNPIRNGRSILLLSRIKGIIR